MTFKRSIVVLGKGYVSAGAEFWDSVKYAGSCIKDDLWSSIRLTFWAIARVLLEFIFILLSPLLAIIILPIPALRNRCMYDNEEQDVKDTTNGNDVSNLSKK